MIPDELGMSFNSWLKCGIAKPLLYTVVFNEVRLIKLPNASHTVQEINIISLNN